MLSKSKYIFYLLALGLVLLFVRSLDMEVLIAQYHKMGWHFYGVLAISLIAYTFGTLGWLLCLDQVLRWSRFKPYFLARLIGESFSLINPTGVLAGDVLKVHLLRRKGESRAKVVESVTISRVLLWVSFVLVLMVTLVLFSYGRISSTILLLVLSLLLMGCAVLLLVLLFHPRAYIYRGVEWIQKRLKWTWLEKRLEAVHTYNANTIQMWKLHRSKLLFAVTIFGTHYLMGALEFKYILWSLGVHIEFSMAVYLEVATSFLRSVMSFIPGQVGIEEYGNKYFLSMLGIKDDSIWMTVSIIRRLRQLLWLTLSVIAYFWYFKPSRAQSLVNKQSLHGSLVH